MEDFIQSISFIWIISIIIFSFITIILLVNWVRHFWKCLSIFRELLFKKVELLLKKVLLKKNDEEDNLSSEEKNINSIQYNILCIERDREYNDSFIYIIAFGIFLCISCILLYFYPSNSIENLKAIFNWFKDILNGFVEKINHLAELKLTPFITSFIAGVGSIPPMISLKTYLHNKKMGKKQLYNWRQKIYEIEQKDIGTYTLNDLYVINSCINPYTKKNLIGYLTNELIYNIYFERPKVVCECRKQLIKILKNGFYDKSYSLNSPSYHSLLELSKEDLENRKFSEHLTLEEALDIKLCCHVLAKLDWEDKS